MKQAVFRTTAPARMCRCGKCAKVATILASPLGADWTEAELRALERGELVDLTVQALQMAGEPPKPYDLALHVTSEPEIVRDADGLPLPYTTALARREARGGAR